MGYNKDGKESEWNEAALKSKRLHDIQELINFFKTNPLGITDGKFNYVWLSKNIDALYGEGRCKYSEKEKSEMDEFKKKVEKIFKFMPPHKVINSSSINKQNQSVIFDEKNLSMLMDFLYDYEMLVRDYNDAHGLTTKNKMDVGMF